MRKHFQSGIASCLYPLCITVLFLLLVFCWHIFRLPSPDSFVRDSLEIYERNGFWIIAAAALLEGLVLVNLYFPGSVVILVGMVAHQGDPFGACIVVGIVVLSFCCSSFLNYAIGCYGLSHLVTRWGGESMLKKTKHWYESFGWKIFPILLVHPNSSAFLSLHCGIVGVNFRFFLIGVFVCTTIWNSVGGVIVYLFAVQITESASKPSLVFVGLVLWTMIAFFLGLRRSIVSSAI